MRITEDDDGIRCVDQMRRPIGQSHKHEELIKHIGYTRDTMKYYLKVQYCLHIEHFNIDIVNY